MTHYSPEFFAQCGPETLRTLHDSLATDAAFYRRHADALTARVAELAAELAGNPEGDQMTDETMTVTLRLRWAEDDDGDSLLLLAGFPVGIVFSMGRGQAEWWHAYGRGITPAIRIKDLSTQAEAMAALQAAVLKALEE